MTTTAKLLLHWPQSLSLREDISLAEEGGGANLSCLRRQTNQKKKGEDKRPEPLWHYPIRQLCGYQTWTRGTGIDTLLCKSHMTVM